MADKIISRAEARARGLKWYFTGKPCPRNHIVDRVFHNRACLECLRDDARSRSREERDKNRDEINARKRNQYAENAGKERVKARERRSKSRVEINARKRELRASDLEKARSKDRERYAKCSDKRRSAERFRREKFRDEINAKRRARHSKSPLKSRVHQATRRALKRSAGGLHTVQDILDILKLQHNRCAYCRAHLMEKYHVDHIVPIKLGGANDRRNLQLLCGPKCNGAKGAKDPIDFARELGRLL